MRRSLSLLISKMKARRNDEVYRRRHGHQKSGVDRYERQARNEALMREVNERIAELDKTAEKKSFDADGETFEFLCECGANDGEAGDCEERVVMTINEYDQVRSQDDRFVVYPGHETETLEWVVARTDRFVIVDKRPAAEPLVADDPRDAPSR